MRIVLQRVQRASVTVDNQIVGKVDAGLLALIGLSRNDTEQGFKTVIDKIIKMRIFSNDKGRFDFSVQDIAGGILLVPQFTLFADTSRGRRPEFFSALEPKSAELLFDAFVAAFRAQCSLTVETGKFGADMKVELLNDGPVTIVFDTEAQPPS